MECKHNNGLTNEVNMMMRQEAISVKLGETVAAVTDFPGVVALANLGKRLDLFADLDELLPQKARARELCNSAAAFDLMCVALLGGSPTSHCNRRTTASTPQPNPAPEHTAAPVYTEPYSTPQKSSTNNVL